MATTRAPTERAIITADRPTPPQPCTATHSPSDTLPWSTIARNEVANAKPRLGPNLGPRFGAKVGWRQSRPLICARQ